MIFSYDSQNIDTPIGDEDSNSLLVGPQLVYNFSINENASIPIFGAIGYASAELEDDDLTGWG